VALGVQGDLEAAVDAVRCARVELEAAVLDDLGPFADVHGALGPEMRLADEGPGRPGGDA